MTNDKELLRSIRDATGILPLLFDSNGNFVVSLSDAIIMYFGSTSRGRTINGITYNKIILPIDKSIVNLNWVLNELKNNM